MWDRTLIESKGFSRGRTKWWTIPAAACVHIVLIILTVVSSYWHVEAVEPQASRIDYVVPISVVLPPIKLGGGVREEPTEAEKKDSVEQELVQPTVIQELSEQPDSSSSANELEHLEGTDLFTPAGPGSPDGVEGGDEQGNSNGLIGIVGPDPEEVPRPITVGIRPPVLIHRVEPEYPRLASRAGIQGMVILEAVITKTGSVEQVKTLRSDHILLERAAIDAVLQWKYQPATLQNRPVKVYFTVTVTFRLK